MEIDFITAFGRLLRDGELRNRFAASPQAVADEIHLRRKDRPAWEQLLPADVEFQAVVLLRKRLDLVKFFAPKTCQQLGGQLWPDFHEYACATWPPSNGSNMADAFRFCQHLREQGSKAVSRAEWNRLHFAFSMKHIGMHWTQMSGRNGRPRRGLQLLLRGLNGRWRELFFYLGF